MVHRVKQVAVRVCSMEGLAPLSTGETRPTAARFASMGRVDSKSARRQEYDQCGGQLRRLSERQLSLTGGLAALIGTEVAEAARDLPNY